MPPSKCHHHFLILGIFLTLLSLPPPTTTTSLPNPIHTLYPTLPTGTLNLTISILPIPLPLARALIPPTYPILTTTYISLLPPSWPPSLYPLIIETRFDHDIYYMDTPNAIPDFQAVAILFPFVDRLYGGDGGGTSFVWTDWILVSEGVEGVGEGARAYGERVGGARFEPVGEGYEVLDGEGEVGWEERVFRAFVEGGDRGSDGGLNKLAAEVRFVDDKTASSEGGVYGMEFYKNITNQPLFSNNASVCDNQIILYNTTLSTGANAPVPIISDIFISNPFFPGGLSQTGVHGIRVDTAWIEKNYLDCETLKGYGGDGGGGD